MSDGRECGNCGATDDLTRMDDPVMPTPKSWLCGDCIDAVTRKVNSEIDR